MTNTYKVLGQSNPSATTATSLYTVPSSTATIVSGIRVANRSSTATTFRVAIRPAGASLSNEHYIAYDVPVPGNDSIDIPGRLSLATTDVITVYAGAATLSFSAYGVEIS